MAQGFKTIQRNKTYNNPDTLFEKVSNATGGEKKSLSWYRSATKQIASSYKQDMSKFVRDELTSNQDENTLRRYPKEGHLFMFEYTAKMRHLPYYDKFPLIIVVGPAEGGFYGLNLHYISPLLRVKLLDALMDNTTDKRYDENTRFKLNYAMLNRTSKLRFYKPCFKHYLLDHVQSRLAHVPSPEWEIATFLPMANWVGARGAAVYKFSKEMI